MEKKIKINIPEGYTIDKEKSTFEEIVFKEIDKKPRSWEEYCNIKKEKGGLGFCINTNADVVTIYWGNYVPNERWRNTLPTKSLAEAFLAMMQLMALRQEWVGDWRPDWSDACCDKYSIIDIGCNLVVSCQKSCKYVLSFPTKEMANDFLNTFKDLLEIAKPLI